MPRITRILAAPRAVGRRATPADFGGGGQQEALGQVAGQIGNLAGELFVASESAKVSKGLQGASTEINDLILEVEKNPNLDEREQQFTKGRQEILGRHRGTILSQRFKNDFDTRVFAISEHSRLQIREGVRAGKLSEIRANTITAVDGLARAAAQAETPELRNAFDVQIEESMQRALESGAFTAQEIAGMRIQTAKTIREAEAVVMAQAITDELLGEFPDDLAAQVRAAKERLSGQEEDRVINRLKDAAGIRNAAAATEERELVNHTMAKAHVSLTRAQALELGLPANALNTVLNVITQREQGKEPEAGSKVFYTWYDGLTNVGTREAFRLLNVTLIEDHITPKEKSLLQGLQREHDLLDQWPKKVKIALKIAALTDLIVGKDKDKALEQEQFRRNMQSAKDLAQQQKRAPLNEDEMNNLVDAAVQEVITVERFPSPGFGAFREEELRFKVRPGFQIQEAAEAALSGILPNERRQTIKILAEAIPPNLDPTEAQIRDHFLILEASPDFEFEPF